MKGAEVLWESLVREGVDTVFGYPGGAILPAYDAMLGYPIRHVLVRHEQGAAHMADGYARATGKVGVAIATSGPGATNLVTGIATAMMDSSPIVCITGQVGSRLLGTDAFQETDITGITLPITKHNYLVTRAEDVAGTIREAFYVARSGRPGPVLVDITKDAQQADLRVRLARRAAAARLPSRSFAKRCRKAPRHRADPRRRAAGDPRRARHLALRRRAGAARVRRTHRHPGGPDAAGPRRLPRHAPAEPRHDGHARRGLGQPCDPGGRPAARLRHALRRPRHRQPRDLRAAGEEDPRRDRPGRDRQERPRRRRPRRRPARGARDAAARHAARRPHRMAARISRRCAATPRCATSRTCPTTATSTPRTSSTTCGARPAAAPSWSPTSASTRCGRRSTTTTSSRAR